TILTKQDLPRSANDERTSKTKTHHGRREPHHDNDDVIRKEDIMSHERYALTTTTCCGYSQTASKDFDEPAILANHRDWSRNGDGTSTKKKRR
ncbi:15764_t:CDS:2, partial [Acaulospora morrowiae]